MITVELVDKMGTDLSAVNAARVSFDKKSDWEYTIQNKFDIESGRIYVFDKGYADYNWWYKISMNNAYFVTRLKKNSAYKVIKDYDITGCSENIKSDRVIEFTNKYPGGSRRNLLAGRSAKISGLL